MSATQIDRSPRLRRAEASEYLQRVHGVRIATSTLEKLACNGGGPRYFKAGVFPLYPTSELDVWAEAKLGDLVSNSTEARLRNKAATV